jgi:polyphosphate glucokinase
MSGRAPGPVAQGGGARLADVDSPRPDAAQVIADLGLARHPEGGWYRETWRDEGGTAILYLIGGADHSAWHRVLGRAETWHFYAGAPLELRLAGDGDVRTIRLDAALDGAGQPQVTVPAGVWQSASSCGAWTLMGTTVAPPFDLAFFELAPAGFDPRHPVPAASNVSPMPNPAAGTPLHDDLKAKKNTLAIDIGGTGLKASVLDEDGAMEHDRVRVDTPYPLGPDKLVLVLTDLVKPLPAFDRISVGFPGMVRAGVVLSAPHFVSPDGPGGEPAPKLVAAWNRYNLQAAISHSFAKPTKVANDADLQGAAVVAGKGLELVVTLGTGVGTALFYDGMLLPHLELAHHSFRKDQTYNEALGDAARKQLGTKKWNKRVSEMIDALRALTFFDHLYIGGGNATKVDLKLDADITLTDNAAGILGGIKLWHRTD